MNAPITIYHNPHCSKSRATLALLEERQLQPHIELYCQKTFSLQELTLLAEKLQLSDVREMLRTKDPLYQTLGLDDAALTQEDLLQAVIAHPKLLERPIVVCGEKAKIGRPPENVLSIL